MRLLISLIILLICTNTSAATLLLPDNANTVLVNGVATEQQQVALDINTPQGLQQIAFRYHARFRDQGSQHSFSSDVIILRFAASDQDYQLSLPSIRSQSNATQFNQQPQITLTNQAGQVIEFTQDKLMKSGLQIGRDFETEIAKYNASGAIAAWNAASVALKPTATTNTNASAIAESTAQELHKTDAVVDQQEVNNMLDYWYQKASPQTQAEFKARINQ
ncbi:DUF2057 domain-containing protein [Shewanella inventionis]|uniref:UPF0319 protein GCM10011607_14530 n=1 Tax=Shewanella inventionis TaxID=1738770 RepID=A0ABQ1IXJ0_9GAMM|nr:DUF2057 domain-containing protein [Shewanella inventionis]MCL1157081.1 DUF2057 domain-containing protein [Shewanella inventionis]GGB55070.1 UPF0319 protein [Shewanella inventionis]